ncbi:MAG: 2-C-methyl-D-erythritol 2,4-cyclodiphosphate synthase, partial [Oscillospiraceae bacterium]|nr:2-C-methyl-D-erythritol 2,4-cyclodiphosphate synthase [Oscillospiraceae bacterium]
AVAAAMERALRTMSSPGRGGYPEAMAAAEAAFECRSALAELYHADSPEQVNIKATTEEGLGFTGDGSGMAAHAVVLLAKTGI